MQALFLAEFSPIQPEIGMIFWALVIFALTWLVLGRFTFKPIARALREREESIGGALAEADRARTEMAQLKTENQSLLKQAQTERTLMMKEAKEAQEGILKAAREQARTESARIVAEAHAEIETQKNAAMLEVKNSAGQLAIDVAQKILRNQLADPSAQQRYANTLIDEIKLN